MIKHKKVTRTLLAVFMALCLFMGPLASKPKAATAGSGAVIDNSNTVATYSWTFINNGVYDVGTNLGIIKSSMHVDIDMTGYYSGSLTITLTGPNNFANIGIFVKGGYLAQVSQNQCKVQLVANTTHIEVDFISNLEFTTLPSWSVSISGNSMNLIDDLEASSLDNIDSTTATISAAITSNTSGLPAIHNDLNSIEDALALLTKFQGLNIPIYQHPAWIWASKYDSGFPRWKYGLPYMQYDTTTNDSTYTASHGIRLANGYSYAMIFYSSKAFSTSNVSVYYSALTGSVQVSTLPITEINSQLYITALIFKNTNSGFTSFEPEFNQSFELYPLYFGLTNNIPDEIRGLLGQEYDNTYTRLLQQISDGIAGLESDQTVIDNSTNITNNFNTDMTTINNIEVSILTGIDNKFDAVDTAIDDSGVLDVFVDHSHDRWVNYMSGVVLDNLTIVKYPIYIILIGFVLLCLLG